MRLVPSNPARDRRTLVNRALAPPWPPIFVGENEKALEILGNQSCHAGRERPRILRPMQPSRGAYSKPMPKLRLEGIFWIPQEKARARGNERQRVDRHDGCAHPAGYRSRHREELEHVLDDRERGVAGHSGIASWRACWLRDQLHAVLRETRWPEIVNADLDGGRSCGEATHTDGRVDRSQALRNSSRSSSAPGPALSSGLCRLIGVDGVREENGRATANQERNDETHGSITPVTSTTHVTPFCFKTVS